MVAIELTKPCAELVSLAKEKGLLINVTADKVIRLLPALIMSDSEADTLIQQLSQLIKDWGNTH